MNCEVYNICVITNLFYCSNMSNQSSTGGEKGVGDNKLMFEALLSEMSKRLSAEMELVHERMDKI